MKKALLAILFVALALPAFAAPKGAKALHKPATSSKVKFAFVTAPKKAATVTVTGVATSLTVLKDTVGTGVEMVGEGVQLIGKGFEAFPFQPVSYFGVAIDNGGDAVAIAGGWIAVH